MVLFLNCSFNVKHEEIIPVKNSITKNIADTIISSLWEKYKLPDLVLEKYPKFAYKRDPQRYNIEVKWASLKEPFPTMDHGFYITVRHPKDKNVCVEICAMIKNILQKEIDLH